MKKILPVFIFCLSLAFTQAEGKTEPLSVVPGAPVLTYGWADMGKMKYSKSKKITLIDDASYPDSKKKRQAFTKAISGSGSRFIVLSGEVDLSDGVISDEDHSYFDEFSSAHNRLHDDIVYSVSSNTTLIGINGAKVKFGGLVIRSASNIIIRNVEFWDAHGSTEIDTKREPDSKASIDNLVILDGSKNIWIDHCTFSDGICNDMVRNYHHDGLIDIPYGMNVTISYCEFKNHDKVMLVGSGEKSLSPKDRSVTLHHNYFHATTQRMPRTRGTYMHIYNNVYDKIGVPENAGYSLGPGTNAKFIVENNYFGSHLGFVIDIYDKGGSKGKPSALIYFEGNSIAVDETNTRSKNDKPQRSYNEHIVAEKPWEIPYEYKSNMQDWSKAKDDVHMNAGAGKEVIIEGL